MTMTPLSRTQRLERLIRQAGSLSALQASKLTPSSLIRLRSGTKIKASRSSGLWQLFLVCCSYCCRHGWYDAKNKRSRKAPFFYPNLCTSSNNSPSLLHSVCSSRRPARMDELSIESRAWLSPSSPIPLSELHLIIASITTWLSE